MTRIDWRDASRWWSVRLSAFGSLLYAAMLLMPERLLDLWAMMPVELRALLPARAGDWLGMILFALVIVARLLPQPVRDHRPRPAERGALSAKALGGTAVIAAALTLAIAGLREDEGKRNTGYADIAGVATICFGHTGPDVRPGQYRSDAECETLLRRDAQAHLAGALACSPELAERPNQLAAVTRLTFNIGVAGYCRSSIARHFAAGRWRQGCDRFLAFRFAGGRPVRGLLLRRQRERTLCLAGLPA